MECYKKSKTSVMYWSGRGGRAFLKGGGESTNVRDFAIKDTKSYTLLEILRPFWPSACVIKGVMCYFRFYMNMIIATQIYAFVVLSKLSNYKLKGLDCIINWGYSTVY